MAQSPLSQGNKANHFMTDFLVFDGVTKRFGDFVAVRDASFSIKKGEIFALLGPSGCGKTTLLRMLAGFIEPDEGRILIEGEDVSKLPPERRPVNTVFQSYALFPHLTIRDNIGFGLKMAKRPKSEIDSEVDRMLDLVDLTEHGDKKPDRISGGQKQRVAIARALVNDPMLILADEPTGNLDSTSGDYVMHLLRRLVDERRQTVVMVTHDPRHAALADRIVRLADGSIVDDRQFPPSSPPDLKVQPG